MGKWFKRSIKGAMVLRLIRGKGRGKIGGE
jgi:hypothetical protein